MLIFYIISGILLFFLLFPFITVIFSLFNKDKTIEKQQSFPQKDYDFANIITAYRNADIAKPLVESLLMQGHENHHIYLVADNADVSKWQIQHEKLTVLTPTAALNLKVKSIIYARENYGRKHDYAIIWDADNLAHPQFLETINTYANAGHKAIQGQRTAKNLNTLMAAADSLGEFYKNYIERLVHHFWEVLLLFRAVVCRLSKCYTMLIFLERLFQRVKIKAKKCYKRIKFFKITSLEKKNALFMPKKPFVMMKK